MKTGKRLRNEIAPEFNVEIKNAITYRMTHSKKQKHWEFLFLFKKNRNYKPLMNQFDESQCMY